MCEDGFFFCCTGSSTRSETTEDTPQSPEQESHEMAATGPCGDDSGEDHSADPAVPGVENARGGRPDHMGPVKQLHSSTGHNLAINEDGDVYGTRELYNDDAILEIRSTAPTEVQIRGKHSRLYVAMNDRGKVYAEEDPSSPNTIWYEGFDDGWNTYVWKGQTEVEWYLGLKKSGKPKRGEKTRRGQKAVRFMPRPAYPQNY